MSEIHEGNQVHIIMDDGRRLSGRVTSTRSHHNDVLKAELENLRINRPLSRALAGFNEFSLLDEQETRASIEYAQNLLYLQRKHKFYEDELSESPQAFSQSLHAVDSTFFSFPAVLQPAVEDEEVPSIDFDGKLNSDHSYKQEFEQEHVLESESDVDIENQPEFEREAKSSSKHKKQKKSKKRSKGKEKKGKETINTSRTSLSVPASHTHFDHRTLNYNVSVTRSRIKTYRCSLFLPGSATVYSDLRPQLPPASSQGLLLGSSCSHVLITAYEYALFSDFRGSVLFAHYNERLAVHSQNDLGIEHAVETMTRTGVCDEQKYPSIRASSRAEIEPPGVDCFQNASMHKIESHKIKPDRESIKKCLSSNFPVVTACAVFPQLHDCPSDGFVQLPERGEKSLGGIALLLVGFDDEADEGVWIVRNSLGKEWGDLGHAYLAYGWENYFSDLYVITSPLI